MILYQNSRNTINKYLLIFILLTITDFFSFRYLELKERQYIHLVFIIYFACICIKYYRAPIANAYNKQMVLLLMLTPLLSVYSCYILHGQSIMTSLIVYRRHLAWLFYFVLYYKRVSEKDIISKVIPIACIFTFFELVQQVTYPFYLFAGREETDVYTSGMEIRMGFYRFAIGGDILCLLALLAVSYQSFLQKKKQIVLILFLCIGVVACVTRQIILGTFIAMAYIYIQSVKNKYKIFSAIGVFVIVSSIYTFREELFGKLAEISETGKFEDNARYISYNYYWNASTKNGMSFFFGNGVPNESSQYGKEMKREEAVYLHILADIGVVGMLYQYGLFFVLLFVILQFRLLLNKYLSSYLKGVIIVFTIMSPMIFAFTEFGTTLFYAIILYLCDLSINKNRKASKQLIS